MLSYESIMEFGKKGEKEKEEGKGINIVVLNAGVRKSTFAKGPYGWKYVLVGSLLLPFLRHPSSQTPIMVFINVTVSWEERDCIVYLEIRPDELIRRLISGELTNYSVVRTSLEPLQ
jgi:hypothetical protein